MKTIKIGNIVMNIAFNVDIFRRKRLTFDLPAWADDTCVTHLDTPDNVYKIKYYKCSKRFYIDLPKCKRARLVSLTPLNSIKDGILQHNTDRKIVVDIDY